MKTDLRGVTIDELTPLLISNNVERFRAEQIFRGIHKQRAETADEINNIPKEIKELLKDSFTVSSLKSVAVSESERDKTRKFLFETTNEEKKSVRIESVHIQESERDTFCISTQAGCNVGCEFCATGKMKLLRNLTAGEIVSQVYEMIKITGTAPSNIVYMGMGEPLLNYDNVLKSILILTDKKGAAIPSKRITVSTVGFEGRIKKFADDIKINSGLSNIKLALSLHSTDNGFREKLIPTSKVNTLKKIYDELVYFYRTTGNKITYEYIYFEGINDTEHDIKRLERLSRMVPCNINVIPFHPVEFELAEPLTELNEKVNSEIKHGKEKSLSNSNNLINFTESLRRSKVTVNIRTSSGVDINAACGQLAIKNY